jgi:DNA-binding NtrC family response regulator
MVRNLDSGIPVVMLSAINTVEMAVKAMKSGTNNYLTKPFNVNELQETVEELSDKYMEACNRIPLDIEIVINEVKEDMLAKGAGLREAGKNFEEKLLETVLKKVNGDREKAANFLGMDDKVLSGKMVAFSLSSSKPVLSVS